MMTVMDAPCSIYKQFFPGKKFHALNALLTDVTQRVFITIIFRNHSVPFPGSYVKLKVQE